MIVFDFYHNFLLDQMIKHQTSGAYNNIIFSNNTLQDKWNFCSGIQKYGIKVSLFLCTSAGSLIEAQIEYP